MYKVQEKSCPRLGENIRTTYDKNLDQGYLKELLHIVTKRYPDKDSSKIPE